MLFSPLTVLLLGTSSVTLALPQDDQNLRQAISALRPQLSKEAIVTFPWNPRWNELQIRASSPRVHPAYNVVVEIASEADVQATVTLANRYNVPFLAISGSHGWTRTLNKLSHGIQINLRKLNTTLLNDNGKTAHVGGGTLQYEITRSLFDKGKYAVTGLAECVSFAGPLLGGGHSLLQGQHGFSLDNLVSARIVLGNGTLVEASETKDSDLFWALRGAGHNFGILTSLEVKVYDIPSTWTVYSLIFGSGQLASLFTLINKFEDPSTQRPAKLALTGVFVRIPAVDANNPVIAYTIAYEGSEAAASPYASQFLALNPLSTTISTNVNYVDLYTVTGNNLASQACVRNNNILGAGTSLPNWDIPGVRNAFSVFANITADTRFNTSITLLENYGMQAVRAVNPASTALAPEEREYNVLASPVLWWDGEDENTAANAYGFVEKMRDALYMGVDTGRGKRHCYVNYANGNGGEDKRELYGYDGRVEKLVGLKKKWDVKGRFGFYNPFA